MKASVPERSTRLWRLMQRIELYRHRAEVAEARASHGSGEYRREMHEVARQWRELAHQAQFLDETSSAPAADDTRH